MSYSFTSDFHVGPEPTRPGQLEHIAAAGFRRLHWCWDWTATNRYGPEGTARARGWLAEAGLELGDTHGTCPGDGREWSADPEQAALGVALHSDRLRFTGGLGGDALVIHPPEGEGAELEAALERQIAALTELVPVIEETGVRLAIENIWPASRNAIVIPALLSAFDPDHLGYCYDSGHANMAGDLDWLVEHAFPRLLVTHLHDNDGTGDQHLLPGDGTVDWARVRAALAAAGYQKPRNLEVVMSERYGTDEEAFLALAHARASEHLG